MRFTEQSPMPKCAQAGSIRYSIRLPDNANLAAALISGGSFVACQLGLWVVFRCKLTMIQTAGIILATAGLFLAALAK